MDVDNQSHGMRHRTARTRREYHRRWPIGIALLLSLSWAVVAMPHFTAAAQNAIQAENALPGTPGWDDLTTVAQQDAINGYASKTSVNHGDSIGFFITTTAASYTIDIYRVGWYNGVGARLMTSMTAPDGSKNFPGVHLAIPPPDPVTGIVDCSKTWSVSATLNVPSTWVTGVYLAKLTASNGRGSYIIFVVRDDGGHEAIVFQTSVTTYQAYNAWGGISLYTNNTNKSIYPYAHATKVSFDRPYDPNDSNGAGHFLYDEIPYLRWAEKQGYDLTYTTDIDTHTNDNPLTNHQAFLTIGHDEYWTMAMRTNVLNAINSGVNVGFFSANTMYWQIRLESNSAGVPNRVQVGYKDTATSSSAPGPDPLYGVNNSLVTTNFRDTPVNLPENAIIGVMYEGQVPNNNYPYVVQNASNWVFAGTGFTNGSSVPGIVGYEYDKVWNNGQSPAGLITLSNSPVCCGDTQWSSGGNSTSQSTIYTAASGARVFASGSIDWSWGLDNYSASVANPGIQKMTANILDNFSSGSSPPPTPAVTLAPTSVAFGNQTVGTTSAPQSITLTNTGNAALSITSIAVAGTNAGDFVQTNTCPVSPATLAAGGNCSISVSFTPSAGGSRSASVTVTDNASGSPHAVALSGTGTTVAAPAVSLSANSLVFGNQTVGSTSLSQAVTLTNTGNAALSISSITVSGSNAGDFSQANTCPVSPATLSAGANCTINVTFAPTASGARAATITISDNAAGSPQSVGLSGTGTTTQPPAGIAPMPVISRAVPAYASNSGYPASYANDGDYSTVWNSVATPSATSPQWLAYDLSSVPTANRTNVVFVWYNDDTGDYIQAGAYYGLPQDYTIEVNAAPGGSLPTSGWTTLVSVTGNTYTGREATLNLSGYNWVRINVTASRGGALDIQADVHDISQGEQDSWLFLGDSITMEGFNHHNIDGSAWQGGNYQQLVNGSAAAYFPLAIDGGAGATNMQWGYTNRAALLANFTGKYVAISFGTNDANVSGALDASTINTWYTNLLGLVDYVTSLGKTPVVGKIPWGSASGGWLATNARTLNSKIDQLYLDRPSVVHGPDLYTFFSQHQNLIGDGIHPTYDPSQTAGTYQGLVGYEWLHELWRDAMLANVYNSSPPSAPAVTLSTTSLSFNTQQVGTTSSAQPVTLTNTGNAALSISSITVSGSNAGDFSQTSDCPTGANTLAASASCTITVTFSPTGTGARSATITVGDNAAGSPHSVSLSGSGSSAPSPAVTLSAASLAFGNQLTGTTSSSQSVTLTNTGNAPLTISSIAAGGTNAADFNVTSDCPASPSTLAAGNGCTISVTFTPGRSGVRSAAVNISDDAAGSPQSVSLSGTGVAPAPAVQISPSSWAFGNQRTGTSSAAQIFTVTNTGTAALSISVASLTGSNTGDFSLSNDACSNATIQPGNTCSVSVRFAPSATGSRTASVSLTDNAANSPQSAALSGTGTAPSVSLSTNTLTFPNQQPNTTSAKQTVTLTNNGTAPLTISAVAVTGTNATSFTVTNGCPLSPSTLEAGQTCTVDVTFSPATSGSYSASLTFSDDAAGSPQAVALSGSSSVISNVIFSDGFESGSLPGAWTKSTVSSGNSMAISTANKHSGNDSLVATHVRGKGSNAKLSKTITGQTSLDVRGYYYLTGPVNWGNVPIMSLYSGGTFVAWVAYYVDPSSPQFAVYDGANGATYQCTVPTLNTWHSVELQWVMASTTAGSFSLWLDGKQICNRTGIKTSPSSGLKVNTVVVGVDSADTTEGLTVYVDDVVVSQNYIGP